MVAVTLVATKLDSPFNASNSSSKFLSLRIPCMEPRNDELQKNNDEMVGFRTGGAKTAGNGVKFHLDTAEDELVTIGDYEFYPRDKLGEGAYGSVYRGRQMSSGGEVALKLIDTSRLKEGELEAIVKAQSECVVQFLDVVKTDRLTYIIMELCDTDLARFLATYGKLEMANLLTVGRSLAEGYMVLHRNGIVHRDIKPQNILLKIQPSEDGPQPNILAVKFTDFGCSRVSSGDGDDDLPCNLAGTFFYMAPEVGANVVENHQYDEEVDMWSMGVVLYQCMTGFVPYDERQLCRLFLHAIDGNDHGFEPPAVDEGPELYRTVVRKLLQLDPSARLKPVQFHSYLAHDQPCNFIQCLRQGSCSNDSRDSKSQQQQLKHEKEDSKQTWKRRVSLDNLPSIRRTASAFFGRLVAACAQQNKVQQHNL